MLLGKIYINSVPPFNENLLGKKMPLSTSPCFPSLIYMEKPQKFTYQYAEPFIILKSH